MHYFTPKVGARRAMCQLLVDRYLADAIKAGLLEADLKFVIARGAEAEEADREQHEQLADSDVARTQRKNEAALVSEGDTHLRNLTLAVAADLRAAGKEMEALWLEKISFERYRYREVKPSAAPAPEANENDEELVRVRVTKTDTASRAGSLLAYCRAVLKVGREPIVAAYAARGMTKERLAELAKLAEKVAAQGSNTKQAAEATKRESEAVAAQARKWQTVRRMIRAAVKGHPDLEKAYAAC